MNENTKLLGKNENTISECTCRGLNLIDRLSSYYIDRFESIGEPEINKTKLYEDAKKLSNDVFNKLRDRGVKYKGDLPPIKSLEDIATKSYLESCNSSSGRDCVMLLEMLMGKLHQSPEAQRKLICGHTDKYLDQQDVDNFLTDILRGEFYGGKSNNVWEIKYNPFREHFYDRYTEICKKYKI